MSYSPTSLNIKAPSGGFQQGGWYNGRQYWNGTLSDPGVIHSESNQIGAGQAVSQEVNRQTSVEAGLAPNANQDYINAQRAIPNPQPAPAPRAPSAPAPLAPTGTGAGAGQPGVARTNTTVDPLGIAARPAPAIDLPNLYKSLQAGSGISEIETQLSALTKANNDAMSKINDNPWLSEATRVGRVSKLATDYENMANALKGDIAVKKADIETQLNLQTKQFDIQSNQAQQAMTQYNTLLSSGALDNASGEDVAAITRATGLSSAMIYGAINSKKVNDVKTSTVSFDDGTNQGFAVINSQTGEIISRQVVAASKPDTSNMQFDDGTNQGFATIDNRTGQVIGKQNLASSKPKAETTTATSANTSQVINSSYGDYINNKVVTINGRTGPVQQLLSPEDFYKILVPQIAELKGDVSKIPTPTEIRKILNNPLEKY